MKYLTVFLVSICFVFSRSVHADAAEDDRRRASEIRSAAATLRSKATQARSQASAARSEAASVRGKTSELQSEEQSARSRRMSMAGEISSANAEESRLRSEVNSLNAEAESARQRKAQVDAEIATNRNILSELLKVVYNLEARVKFKEKERDDLEALKQQVKGIYDNLNKLSNQQRRAAIELTSSADAHMMWMKQLSEVIARLAPPFKDLRNSDEVKIAAYRASAFPNQAPNPDQPNLAEEAAVKTEREISALTQTVQEQLRQIGMMPGLAVYHKYSEARFDGDYWKDLDESIHTNIELALQIETLSKMFAERRGYLVRVIPVMWERMLNVRLDSIHLEKAVRTGQIVLDGLPLPQLVSRAAELDNQHNQAALLLLRFYSPYLASEQIEVAMDLASQFTLRLNQMQPSRAVEQVRVTVESKIKRLQRLREKIERELQVGSDNFLKKRQTTIATITSARSQTTDCQAWKKTVDETSANKQNEIAYYSFMESCT